MHVNPHIGCVCQYGGIENKTFTFYHVFSFFHLDFCLRSLLSAQPFVCVAFCLRGRLSTPVLVRQPLTCCFVTAAFCLRGLLSSRTFVCAAFCLCSLLLWRRLLSGDHLSLSVHPPMSADASRSIA